MSPQLPADAQNRSFIIFVSISEFAKIECENTSTNDTKFIIYSILYSPQIGTSNEMNMLNMARFYIIISASDNADLTPKRSTPRRFGKISRFSTSVSQKSKSTSQSTVQGIRMNGTRRRNEAQLFLCLYNV